MIGTILGHYRIVEKIGEGGMGVVYRAHDERLDRDVAIKVLPESVAQDPDRIGRFEREARAVAKLNHPNILAIHDFGNQEGIAYAVMELLDGESLREALLKAAGPLPWRRAQEIGAAVATGLGAAHHQGIVHRDIKPENIFLTRDGQIKILDFGLAQIQEPVDADADTATLTPAGTVPGTVMGTVGYMSPEQVRGEPADARSDIFALGCVLYEMLAGHHAFKRETTAEIMAAILREEPRSLVESGVDIAPEIEKTVERCLEKNPERRYQSARDLAFAMESLTGSSTPVAPISEDVPAASRFLPLFSAILGCLAVLMTVPLWMKPSGSDLSTYRFTPFATDAPAEDMAAWSPDGRSIAYVKRMHRGSQIFVRSLDADSAIQVTDLINTHVFSPFWSPDGNRIWYRTGGKVWSIGRAGGEPELAQEGAAPRAGAFSPDGRTLATWKYGNDGEVFDAGVWLASPPTASPRPYEPAPFKVNAPLYPVFLRFSPDNKQILVAFPGDAGVEMWLLPYPDGDQASGEPRRILADRVWPRTPEISWMPDSRRVVMAFRATPGSKNQLWIADTQNGSLTPFTAGVMDESSPDVSPDGSTIVFSSGRPDYDLVEVPLDGLPKRVLLATSRDDHSAAWVPNENRFVYMTDRGGEVEIRVRSGTEDWDRAIVTEKDFPGDITRIMRGPIVSPDGKLVAYDRQPENGLPAIWISPIAGGSPAKLIETKGAQYGPDWSPDGSEISFLWADDGVVSIAKVRMGSSEAPQTLVEGFLVPSLIPIWSPTGDWIVYFSRKDSEFGLRLVSPDGASTRFLADVGIPAGWVWSSDGKTIYTIKVSPGKPQLLAVDVETGSVSTIRDFEVEVNFNVPFAPGMRFTLAPDGKSFSTTVVRDRMDLWLLEGFDSRRSWLDRLR